MRQDHGSPDYLISVPGIYSQVYRHVHGLVELGKGRVLDQGNGLRNRIFPRPVHLRHRTPELLSPSGHQSTTSSPMERAVPAIIRMALSKSAALRSAILISAIFLTWALVTRPTLARLG